jgi:hypothetical protein
VIALLAHQGGWDELLLTVGFVVAMLGVSRLRRRSARRSPDPMPALAPAPGPPRSADACAYCGTALTPDDVVCPACGFHRSAAR